jgi:serine/threonine-protein kinase
MLLRRHGGKAPATLQGAEAASFARRVDGELPGAGQSALALLRSLLAPHPGQRPRHALEISRALAAIRAAGVPAWPTRLAA